LVKSKNSCKKKATCCIIKGNGIQKERKLQWIVIKGYYQVSVSRDRRNSRRDGKRRRGKGYDRF